MLDSQDWQRDTLPQLSQLFENDPEAKAFLLTGSLANPEIEVDGWSDMDVTVILADEAVAHYTQSLAWLHPFGRLIGAERHESQLAKTVRVCLEGFKRFDFVFVPESAVGDSLAQASGLLRRPCLILWSRLPNLEAQFVSSPLSLIAHSCETFDGLALEVLPNYVARSQLMRPIIEMARKL